MERAVRYLPTYLPTRRYHSGRTAGTDRVARTSYICSKVASVPSRHAAQYWPRVEQPEKQGLREKKATIVAEPSILWRQEVPT